MSYGDSSLVLALRLLTRDAQILRFLYEACPLPLPTRTLARALFQRPNGKLATAERRAWRRLNTLRKLGFVSVIAGPSFNGRPPVFWNVTKMGMEAAVGHSLVGEESLRARNHKSFETILHREHDLHVQEAKAVFWEMAAKDPRFKVVVAETKAIKTFTLSSGETLTVVPDLMIVLEVGGQRICCLAEVQGVATSLERVQKKVRNLLAYLASGQARATYNAVNFRLIFITFSPDSNGNDHLHNLLEAVGEVPGADRLVYGTTIQQLLEHGLTAPIWMRPLDLSALKASLPEPLRSQFKESRHKGNALRARRDRLVKEKVKPRRLVE